MHVFVGVLLVVKEIDPFYVIIAYYYWVKNGQEQVESEIAKVFFLPFFLFPYLLESLPVKWVGVVVVVVVMAHTRYQLIFIHVHRMSYIMAIIVGTMMGV